MTFYSLQSNPDTSLLQPQAQGLGDDEKNKLSKELRKANKNFAGQAPEGDWTTLATPMCNGGLES